MIANEFWTTNLVIKIFRQLLRNRAAFEQENETEQQRKNFQEKPKRPGARFVLAGCEIIRAELERAEQNESESNEADDEESGFRVGVHFKSDNFLEEVFS